MQNTSPLCGHTPSSESAPLTVGDEAWCLVYEPVGRSGTRWQLNGCARVEVEAIEAERYRVRIVLAAGAGVVEGHRLELARRELYSCADRAERVAFGEHVSRFWRSR